MRLFLSRWFLRHYRYCGVLLMVVLGLGLVTFPLMAQGEGYTARYEGIPFSRTADGGFVLGEPDARVAIVEFADFICTHCQDYQEIAHEFIDTYVKTGEAKFEYRLFPIVDEVYSPLTAQWATCADEQKDGAFWPAHDALFDLAASGQLDRDSYKVLADIVGVDADKLSICAETADQHEIDSALAASFGITGTPGMLVRLGDDTLVWPFVDGQLYNRGGLPMVVLDAIMAAEDINEVVLIQQSLLEGLVEIDVECEAPCWNGIIPGETTWEEGLEYIENQRHFTNIETSEASEGSAKMIQWQVIGSQLNASNSIYSDDGEVVAQINLIELSPYSLGQLIDAQGEPTFAVGNATQNSQVILNLFYPEKLMGVIIFVDGIEASDLNEASQVIGAYFFSEDSFTEITEAAPLVEWEGYEAFENYLTE